MKDSKYGLKIFLRKKLQAAFQAIRIIKMNVPTFLHLFQLFASYISNTRFRVKVLPAVSFTRDYRWEDWNLYTFWSLLEVVLVVVSVAHSCLTLGYPMDCSPLGFSVHGILQAKLLEWVAIPFPRRPSQTRDQTWVPALWADTLPSEPPGSPRLLLCYYILPVDGLGCKNVLYIVQKYVFCKLSMSRNIEVCLPFVDTKTRSHRGPSTWQFFRFLTAAHMALCRGFHYAQDLVLWLLLCVLVFLWSLWIAFTVSSSLLESAFQKQTWCL